MSLKPIDESITEEKVLHCSEDDVKRSYKLQEMKMESTLKALYTDSDEKKPMDNKKRCAGNKAKNPLPLPNSKSN